MPAMNTPSMPNVSDPFSGESVPEFDVSDMFSSPNVAKHVGKEFSAKSFIPELEDPLGTVHKADSSILKLLDKYYDNVEAMQQRRDFDDDDESKDNTRFLNQGIPKGLDPVYVAAARSLDSGWHKHSHIRQVTDLTKELVRRGQSKYAANFVQEEFVSKVAESVPLVLAATSELWDYGEMVINDAIDDVEVGSDKVSNAYQDLLNKESDVKTMFDMEPEVAKMTILRCVAYMTVDSRLGQILVDTITDSHQPKMVKLKEIAAKLYKEEHSGEHLPGHITSTHAEVANMLQSEVYQMLDRTFTKISTTQIVTLLMTVGGTLDLGTQYANIRRIVNNTMPMHADRGLGKIVLFVMCRQAVESRWGKGFLISIVNYELKNVKAGLLTDDDVVKEITAALRVESVADFKDAMFNRVRASEAGEQLTTFFTVCYLVLLSLLIGSCYLDCHAVYLGFSYWTKHPCEHNVNRLWLIVGALGLAGKYSHPVTTLLYYFDEENSKELVKNVMYNTDDDNTWVMALKEHLGVRGVMAVAFAFFELCCLIMITIYIPFYDCSMDEAFDDESNKFIRTRWYCYFVILLVIPFGLYLDHLMKRLEDGHLPKFE